MHTIYLLSGPPRVGKTTIMNNLVSKTGVQLMAADALEHGLRNVLIGEPHQMLRGIKFEGLAEFKTSFVEVGEWKKFSNNGNESEMLLEFIVGMFDYYRRNKESVALEGTEFSPEWVAKLNVPGFKVKAAYVGYTNASHLNHIFAHAKDNEHDWINDWLELEGGDKTRISEWVKKQANKCQQLKNEAESCGYPFFDVSSMSFERYLDSVEAYFLEK